MDQWVVGGSWGFGRVGGWVGYNAWKIDEQVGGRLVAGVGHGGRVGVGRWVNGHIGGGRSWRDGGRSDWLRGLE